jgi:hypothetical protein
MQIQNLLVYSSAIADASSNGPWIEVSNLVGMSIQVNTYQATTDIEVSNDPNVMIDGAGIGPPSAAPVLSQFLSQPGNLSTQPPDPALITSQLPATIFYVKTTFITKWGETTASPASSPISVAAGNYLYVAAPVPSAAQAPFVTGYNVYVDIGGGGGTYYLQTGPQYQPQRLIDGIGTVGGTVTPLGPNQSTHFAISGALPIKQPGFAMVNGFQQTQWVPPVSDASGGTNSGVSVSNAAGLASLITTPNDNTSVAVFGNGGNLMWSPSSMTWKFIRVTHGAAGTVAYLNGQRG